MNMICKHAMVVCRQYILPVASLGAFALGARATPEIAGPIAADVERVVDGDTVRVSAKIWVDQRVSVAVRLKRSTRRNCSSRNAKRKGTSREKRSPLWKRSSAAVSACLRLSMTNMAAVSSPALKRIAGPMSAPPSSQKGLRPSWARPTPGAADERVNYRPAASSEIVRSAAVMAAPSASIPLTPCSAKSASIFCVAIVTA